MKSNHCVFVLSKRYEKGIVDDAPAVGRDLGSERHQRQHVTHEERRHLTTASQYSRTSSRDSSAFRHRCHDRVAVSRLEMRGWPTSFGQPRRAGLAGFEPATHGPGNRLSSSVILRNADFYAVSALSLLHHITKIDCHKLSNRLSALRSVESLGRYSERCSVACGGRAHTRLLGQSATGAQNGSECVS